jgi:tetratricopeptide (TPR) repeat protein
MPIRPKHTPSEGRPVAQRQFTDREDFIKTFRYALAAGRRDQPLVVVYYGVGGIGKTSLRKELRKLIAEPDGTVTAVLDFETPNHRDMETALFALRKSLLNDFKVHFPTFDIAYAVYWQKSRPQASITGENLSLLQDSMVLSDLLAAVGVVPIVGVIPRLPYLFAKGRKVLQDWWTRRGSEELKELPSLEPQQIAERLPMFWASDLKDFLATKGSRAVLFLDTYEALIQTERSEGQLYKRDEWVRELVAQLPEVLWVICGREMLRWAELDADWKDSLSQHLVGGLADEDARQFLRTCGIEDRTIADKIVQASTGLPYYLDLAVDTYLEAKRRGVQPQPDDFAHTPAEVFARFLRHLTQPEIETLKVLAVPRFWDNELFESLVTRFNTGYPLTAFTDLCRFSFISESASKGTYTMHQLMRQSLQEHASPELANRAHRFLFELYDGLLKDIDIRNITDRLRTALAEAFYHGRAALPVQEFFQWFLKPAEQFEQAAQWRLLVPLYEQVSHDLEGELGAKHPDSAESLNNLARLLVEQSKYAEAEPLFRRALTIREEVLGPERPEVAASLTNLAALLRRQGMHSDAEPLLLRALAIDEKVLGPDHPEMGTVLSCLALLYKNQGKYAEAEPLYQRAVEIGEKTLGAEHPDLMARLTDLASLYQVQGKYAEAEPLFRRVLTVVERAFGPDHPETGTVLNSLAWLYYRQGKYADAEPLYLRALAVFEKALEPEHPHVANSLNNLAQLYYYQGRYAEAEPLFQRAIMICEKTLGPEHPDQANKLSTLANVYRDQGKYARAEPLYKRAIEIGEKTLGPEHPNCAYWLNNLAVLYRRQDKSAEAEPLYRRAIEISEKTLGPEHPDLAIWLNNLAQILQATDRVPEAESLLQRALGILETKLGPEHSTVAFVLNNLASIRLRQNRHADAEPLFRRALAITEKALGPDHPNTARALVGLASLSQALGRLADVEPFLQRALETREKKLGPDHPDVAEVLEALAEHYDQTGRRAKAREFRNRTKAIREKSQKG